MARVRISTTVDKELLAKSRRMAKAPDSKLMDRALSALIDEIEAAAEIRALEAYPYDADPDVASVGEDPPVLPYDGTVPKEVLARARARRRRA